ncbi:MAG: BON domain-containing protein [Nitrospirae bacterium]|nr:BON domain-containing protein [Nitrospirota bacterium]
MCEADAFLFIGGIHVLAYLLLFCKENTAKIRLKEELTMKQVLIFLMLAVFLTPGCASLTGETAGQKVDDSMITAKINERIIADPDLHYLKINVDTFQGHVTLTGSVPSKAAQDKLVKYAQETKGVKDVKTNLIIQSPK